MSSRFELDGILYAVIRFAQRFGPLTEWLYPDPPPPWPDWGRDLVGCTIDSTRYGITLDVSEHAGLPPDFALYQNFPNPFNPATVISYSLSRQTDVTIRVVDLLGREIRALVDETLPAGTHSVTWDGRDAQGRPVSSGVYLYQLRTSESGGVRKMLLMR